MRDGKTKSITITLEDYNKVYAWKKDQVGLSLMGAIHQIIDIAEKAQRKRNDKGQFTTKEDIKPE